MQHERTFWLAAIEAYIRDCRIKATTVRASEFAALMNRTPVQLAKEFHQAVGVTVKDYISARRMEHAKELLCTTARDTANIAIVAGFGTARSFYRAFKRSAGISPTAFRKQMSLGAPVRRA